jgi:hypothetical protein
VGCGREKADAGDAAVSAADHGESLKCKGRPRHSPVQLAGLTSRASQSIGQKICPGEEADNLPCFPRDSGQTRKAGEGTRTLDIQLGKLALYQLSYARGCLECSSRGPAYEGPGAGWARRLGMEAARRGAGRAAHF